MAAHGEAKHVGAASTPRIARISGVALILLFAVLPTFAAFASPPSAEAFFAAPVFDAVRLSPSGEHLGALVSTGGERRLLVMPTSRDRARLLPMPAGLRDYRWATDERLLLITGSAGASAGLAAVNRDGSGYRTLVRARPNAEEQGAVLVDLLSGEPSSVLVADDRRRRGEPDVFRVNVFDGGRELAARNPGRVFRWWTDRLGRVRLGMAWSPSDDGIRYGLIHRFGPDTAWRRIHEAPLGGPFLTPLTFDTGNRQLFVASSVGRDTTAVQRFDTVTMELGEVVHARPDADVAGMDAAPDGGVAAVRYETERPVEIFLDGPAPKGEARLDARFPGLAHRIVSRSRDGRRAVVLVHGEREPGRFYLLNREPFELTPVGARLPWLAGRIGPREPIEFSARDGRRLQGYLSLPPDDSGSPKPLLVMPHGGPWARDLWGFDAPAQYFAVHGYAVLQVNFRGSRGLGREHLMAGRGEWDGDILDDLADGVRWAVDEGIADPDRVAILGASFGGYAALMSAVRYPGTYRCAVSFAGVTDLTRQMESLKDAGNLRALEEWRVMVGDPDRQAAALVEASPLNFARAIEVPVMLAHGAEDDRVSLEQSRELASALERAGKSHRFMILGDVGHGLDAGGARAAFFREALGFMDRSMGR